MSSRAYTVERKLVKKLGFSGTASGRFTLKGDGLLTKEGKNVLLEVKTTKFSSYRLTLKQIEKAFRDGLSMGLATPRFAIVTRYATYLVEISPIKKCNNKKSVLIKGEGDFYIGDFRLKVRKRLERRGNGTSG